MAIALTTQPTSNGYYSGYLPVKFVATETANDPAYLDFTLLTSAGNSIDGVPTYRALNVSNEFHFDASNYLQSILNVRSSQGLSTTAIEELTDSYGKFEVRVSDPINSLTSLTSNEFYAFANIDGLRYSNDQTANDGISRKVFLYSCEPNSSNNFPFKVQSDYDRVVLFNTANELVVYTYADNKPNDASTISLFAYIDVSSYVNELISVPLNQTFLQNNLLLPPSGTPITGKLTSWAVYNGTTGNIRYFHNTEKCNAKEFVYINRYGAKECIVFNSADFKQVKVESDEFQAAGHTHTGNTGYFNTSANREKINQDILETFDIRGLFKNRLQEPQLTDFVSSPKHWLNNGTELVPINVVDGTYTVLQEGRGIEFNFKYNLAQRKLAFK